MQNICIRRTTRADYGFTLLEVLVALAILSLSLAVIFAALSGSLRGRQVAEAYQHATLLAESKLSTMGTEAPLEVGTTGGDFGDGFRWKATVAPYRDAVTANAPQLPARPMLVSVTVAWGQGAAQSVSLSTLRLARRE